MGRLIKDRLSYRNHNLCSGEATSNDQLMIYLLALTEEVGLANICGELNFGDGNLNKKLISKLK